MASHSAFDALFAAAMFPLMMIFAPIADRNAIQTPQVKAWGELFLQKG